MSTMGYFHERASSLLNQRYTLPTAVSYETGRTRVDLLDLYDTWKISKSDTGACFDL